MFKSIQDVYITAFVVYLPQKYVTRSFNIKGHSGPYRIIASLSNVYDVMSKGYDDRKFSLYRLHDA
jgi:hypothetical protein